MRVSAAVVEKREAERLRPVAKVIYRFLRDSVEPGYGVTRGALLAELQGVNPLWVMADMLAAVQWMRGQGVRLVVARPRDDPAGESLLALGERLPEAWDGLL